MKILLLPIIFVSCTNTNLPFISNNKNQATEIQVPNRIPNQPTRLPNTPYNPPAKPADFKPLPRPLPVPYVPPTQPVPPPDSFLPPVTTPTSSPSEAPSPAPSSAPKTANGVVQWTIFMIANQDTKNHPTDGQRMEITSSSGELLATAIVDEFSIINGESAAGSSEGDGQDPIGGSPFTLRTTTKYMSSTATAMSGDQQVGFRIFVPVDENASYSTKAAMKDVPNAGHSNGISTIPDSTATAQFKSGNIMIKSIAGAGQYGSCPGRDGIPCMAGVHPSRMYAFARPSRIGKNPGSPLVIDFSKEQKLNLTAMDDKKFPVKFDLKNSGKAASVGWIGKNAGLLCMDLNGDGKIKSGRELFGEYSHRIDGKNNKFENGFIALSQYDIENKGYIDASNPIFKNLKIWFDKNHNGISEPNELVKVESLGIKKINLHFETFKKPMKIAGNIIPIKAIVEMTDGSTKNIYDVFFQNDDRRTLAEIQNSFLNHVAKGDL